jgi:hypothetical protein
VEPVEVWAEAFVLTLAVETPVLMLSLPRPAARWVVASLGLNCLTHPALWYVVPRFEPWAAWVAVAEVGVWATEALALAWVLRRQGEAPADAARWAAGATLAANVASTTVGLLR